MTADRKESIAEIAARVRLEMAAVATAWPGYQAARWHGAQAVASGRATARRMGSTRASDMANRQVLVDR